MSGAEAAWRLVVKDMGTAAVEVEAAARACLVLEEPIVEEGR